MLNLEQMFVCKPRIWFTKQNRRD